MIQLLSTTHKDATTLMRERTQQIYEKLKSGETEEAIVTGGNAFTETVWNKMLENLDEYLDQVKEDQELRFSQMDKEKEELEFQLEKQEKKEQEELFLEKRLFERSALQERRVSAAMLNELDETVGSISGRTSTISKDSGYETVTAEQIAELFREQEER